MRFAGHLWFGTLLLTCVWAAVGDQPTQPQLVLPCRVVSVHDGDTLTAEVTLRMNVRLLDCWAPELREPGGKESRDKLVEIAGGKSGLLTVPLGDDLGDSLTFGRVLGRLEIDGHDVSEQMVESGRATKTKRG